MPKKVKPNQPCPCGSGAKFKKCCGFQGTPIPSPNFGSAKGLLVNASNCQHQVEEKCHDCASPQRHRFRIGDRVEACVGDGCWKTGTIVALDYIEPGWLGDVPYQICLDGVVPRLIYAPFDSDDCVRELIPQSSPMKRQRLPAE